MRRAVLLLVPLLLGGCEKEVEKKPAESDPEVRVKVGDMTLGLTQLRRNGEAQSEYDAWRAKWFEGGDSWEEPRPFRGERKEVQAALAGLDELAGRWEGTPAAHRAAVMRRLMAEADKIPDG